MNASTTMTIRVPAELKERLERLAQGTRRSRSFLAADAVAAYVDRELAIIDGIQQGLADVAGGRVTDHDAAMGQIDAAIAEARTRKA